MQAGFLACVTGGEVGLTLEAHSFIIDHRIQAAPRRQTTYGGCARGLICKKVGDIE